VRYGWAGIVCGNISAMAERASAPYNGGRMAAQMRRESPAKVAEIPQQEPKKHREPTEQAAKNGIAGANGDAGS